MKLLLRSALATITLLMAVAVGMARAESVHANLRGFEETPSAISTGASGEFHAKIIKDSLIEYELSYSGLEGTITQSHIHFGRRGVSGGISLWLCQSATNKDPTNRAPTCPQEAQGLTTVKGSLTALNLVGPTAQGIVGGASGGTAEEFAEIIKAIRANAAYANVHSSVYTTGEIRGQIRQGSEQK